MAMIRFCRFVFVLMILGPIDAVAQPASDDPVEGPWSGTAEVSLIATSGNSDTHTFGLGAEVTYDPGAWRWLASSPTRSGNILSRCASLHKIRVDRRR